MSRRGTRQGLSESEAASLGAVMKYADFWSVAFCVDRALDYEWQAVHQPIDGVDTIGASHREWVLAVQALLTWLHDGSRWSR